jgi:hypothetical protein
LEAEQLSPLEVLEPELEEAQSQETAEMEQVLEDQPLLSVAPLIIDREVIINLIYF